MNNNDAVIEFLLNQLRQQVNKKDVTSFDVSVQISDINEVKQVIHNLQQHIAGKDDEIRVRKDRLRQQLPVVDVMGEIKRWSIDRSIAGRGNYTDEENAIIDAYIGLEHNPYKQQCEDLAHEVQSLKNQLRDASAQIKELHKALATATGGVEVYKLIREQEQSGCRKEDTQYNTWRPHYGTRQPVPDGTMVFIRYRNGEKPKTSVDAKNRLWIWDGTYSDIVEYKIDIQKCEHEWRFYGAGFSCKCIKCGAIS